MSDVNLSFRFPFPLFSARIFKIIQGFPLRKQNYKKIMVERSELTSGIQRTKEVPPQLAEALMVGVRRYCHSRESLRLVKNILEEAVDHLEKKRVSQGTDNNQ